MEVRVTRSTRRTKSVCARVVNGVLEVSAPSHMSDAELTPIIARLEQRIGLRRERARLDDRLLEDLAARLNASYFGGELRWASIAWTTQQVRRYGSCTPGRGTIRISHRVVSMPAFVLEYVVLHELAHLRVSGHGPAFWQLVNRYPLTERARGYLMGVGLEGLEGLDDVPDDVDEGAPAAE